MAKILIKNLEYPISIENSRAEALKKIWLDESTTREKIVNIEHWTGAISQIKSIEMERPKPIVVEQPVKQLSREEQEKASARMHAFVREKFPEVYKRLKIDHEA